MDPSTALPDSVSASGPAVEAAENPSGTPCTASERPASAERTALLLGNVNVGKTTLFNRLCGKHLKVSNYPGTSISIGRGTLTEGGADYHVVDTPGINGVMPESEDERISREMLLDERPDVIALIADGKNLRKSLLLTIQLAEFGSPMVLDINMMDEVRQRGISIDTARLSSLIGIPVTQTVATEGEGVGALQKALPDAARPSLDVPYPSRVESALSIVTKLLKGTNLPARAVGAALLAGDEDVKQAVEIECGQQVVDQIESIIRLAQSDFNSPLSAMMLEARLRAVDRIVAEVQTVSPPARMPFSEKLGDWSRRPLTGIPIAALVVVLMFLFVGGFGAQTLVGLFEGQLFGEGIVPLTETLLSWIPYPIIIEAFVGKFGLVSMGLTLAFGVVVPVLATFFFAFGILEESGYLPRLSVLLDRVLQKVGLTGKGVLPLVLGFSCITMAILTTRMLETKRERFIATVLLVLGIPCAPVFAVIMVLLASMSIWATVTVFGVVFTQIVVVGFVLGKMLPGGGSDFILELPALRVPRLSSLLKKTGWRVWWFIREAVPLFLLATLVLFVLEKLGGLAFIERVAEPVLTRFLDLPAESVQVAIMTLIRKESGAAYLKQLGESGLFDNVQLVVCLLLLTFLSPCVNALIVMFKERGFKAAMCIMAFIVPYALTVGATVNLVCRTLGVSFE